MQKRQKKHSAAPRLMLITTVMAVVGVVAMLLVGGAVDPKPEPQLVEKPIVHEALAR